jgi:hypothetical protein
MYATKNGRDTVGAFVTAEKQNYKANVSYLKQHPYSHG